MLRRHGSICPYCDQPMTYENGRRSPRAPTRDHVIPLSRGGSDRIENIVICCLECNGLKGALLPDEFAAWKDGRATRLDIRSPPKRARPYNIWDPVAREWKTNPLNGPPPGYVDQDSCERAGGPV